MIFLWMVLGFLILLGIFILTYPSFGGHATKEDKQNYVVRSSNYKDGNFLNAEGSIRDHSYEDAFENRTSKKGRKPSEPLPVCHPDFSPDMKKEDVALTWFGHSSVLIRMNEMNILFDPVFSRCCSPISFIGPARFSWPNVSEKDFPEIDICILTHDHYDHMDYRTIRAIDSKVKQYFTPLGCEKHLQRFGVNKEKIHNMAWWESNNQKGLSVSCVPTRHFSGRRNVYSNPTLWGGWVLKDKNHQLFISGDTGFTKDSFEAIHKKFGDMDLVLLDSSQYLSSWHPVHMFPEESVEAACILGAKLAMPYHWGAFVLSTHSWDDPPRRFLQQAAQRGLPCITPKLCETISLSNANKAKEKWWEPIR